MVQHTPGEWTIDDMSLPSRHFIRITQAGHEICQIGQDRKRARLYGFDSLRDEIKANARLIVAAPDMLAFIDWIAEWGPWDGQKGCYDSLMLHSTAVELRKKARGE